MLLWILLIHVSHSAMGSSKEPVSIKQVRNLSKLGASLICKGDFERGERSLQAAIKIAEDEGISVHEPYFQIAKLYFFKKRNQEAHGALDKALFICPSPECFCLKISIHLEEGDFEIAMQTAQQCAETHPQESRYKNNLAHWLHILACEEMLSKERGSQRELWRIAQLLNPLLKGVYKKLKFDKLLFQESRMTNSWDEKEIDFFNSVASTLLQDAQKIMQNEDMKPYQASRYLFLSTWHNPTSARTFYALGTMFISVALDEPESYVKNMDQAYTQFSAAIDLGADFEEAYFCLGWLLEYHYGKKDEAFDIFSRGLQVMSHEKRMKLRMDYPDFEN